MDPQFPGGISMFALMWAVPYLGCVGRPLTPLCLCVCVCGRPGVKGSRQAPFLLWQCLDVVRD